MTHMNTLVACGTYTEEPSSCNRNRINPLPESQPSYFCILAYPIRDSWMIGSSDIEEVQSSDVIFGVVAFLGCLQAFILADRKNAVLYIPNMLGPNGNGKKWLQEMQNGISEIK